MQERSLRTSRRRLVIGSGAALLTLAACGGPDDGVRPFSEVQSGDLEFEADPTNLERGIFRVRTTEPMICAIVWGETPALGRFNNSLAMNGTGIVDHDVFLPDLVPGDTYHYRVQGSTADGTLYQSELDTFVIPVLEDAGSGDDTGSLGDNLALAATVADVSSEFNESFAAANAIDDSGTSEWASDGDGDDAHIALDLGAEHEIAAVEYITRSMLDGTAIVETFTVTIDGETLGPFSAGTPAAPNTARVDAAGRTVRFDVETSTGGNVGAVELRVLAP